MGALGVALLVTAHTTILLSELFDVLQMERASFVLVTRRALEATLLDTVDVIVYLVLLSKLRWVRDILTKEPQVLVVVLNLLRVLLLSP